MSRSHSKRVFTLKAQVADQSGLADAVRAINFATAQGEKDTPSLIDVKGLWSSEGILWQRGGFSTVVEEDEGIHRDNVGVSVEQATEITTTAIDLEFLPIVTKEERGVQNLEFVLQQMHPALMALTSCEANDTVANSRRRLQKRYDPTTGGRKRNLLQTIMSPGRCSRRSDQARGC